MSKAEEQHRGVVGPGLNTKAKKEATPREIKFRAWDGNIMRYANKEQFVIQFGGTIGSFNGETYDTVEWPIMQFTGLKDKNGNEIYEGDILAGEERENNICVGWSEFYASFVFSRKGWMYQHWFGESCTPENVEVIGNIYQTPDLL